MLAGALCENHTGRGLQVPPRNWRRTRCITPIPTCAEWRASETSRRTGADARGPRMLILEELPGEWTARQIFDDPAGDHDWGFSATVDLAASDEAGVAVVTVTDVGQL